jgi:hypothetical protein
MPNQVVAKFVKKPLDTIDANRFPEKFYPGRFDYTGLTSHAIWHVFVCLGIFVSNSKGLLYTKKKKKLD